MVDTREDILARLVEVVASVPNLRTVHRNNVELVDDQMPAGSVLDGDEEVVSGNDGSRPSNRPLIVQMTPEVVVMEQSDQIGSDLTTIRRELIKRVLSDTNLNERVGSNGKISYGGCQTNFGWQEKWYGHMQVQFTFKYPLKLEEL